MLEARLWRARGSGSLTDLLGSSIFNLSRRVAEVGGHELGEILAVPAHAHRTINCYIQSYTWSECSGWTNEKRGDLADKLMRLHLDLAAFILEKMSFFSPSPSLISLLDPD